MNVAAPRPRASSLEKANCGGLVAQPPPPVETPRSRLRRFQDLGHGKIRLIVSEVLLFPLVNVDLSTAISDCIARVI